MKIIFFCGAAEPGSDGVGDYTRRLCGEIIKLEHLAQIVSLCDFHIARYLVEKQKIGESEVTVYRIPKTASYLERLKICQEILKEYRPDWISLQFVAYGFNPKGMPFWLPSFLKMLKGNYHWHIMFHELWLGIDQEASFKHKCIGKVQQWIIKKIIANLKPKIINTQNQLYQFILQMNKIEAIILPICSNIPKTASKKEENRFTQFVLFGTIHQGAPLDDFIKDLVVNGSLFLKPIKIVFIGINGSELGIFLPILDNYGINYEVLGRQSEQYISQVLVNSDYGISTTPYFQTEKSGIYAAYKEHQLASICVARQWTPMKEFQSIPPIIHYQKNNLNLKPITFKVFDLNYIANQFLKSIS